MSAPVRVLGDGRRLGEAQGVRFTIEVDGVSRPAFAVRWRRAVYAYVNVCRHQGLELDFGDARFFDDAADALVCVHHGARYRVESGECLSGACAGGRLTRLEVVEKDGALWCLGPAPR